MRAVYSLSLAAAYDRKITPYFANPRRPHNLEQCGMLPRLA